MLVFVLHGFASATPNNNTEWMEKLFPNDTVIGLNYSTSHPTKEVEKLVQAVNGIIEGSDDKSVLFVGASLGGFMAQYLAKVFNARAVIINPATKPWEQLRVFIGENTNHKTGEKFTLTEDDVKQFKQFYVKQGDVPTLVLLDMGDELLDSVSTATKYTFNADVVTFPGGTHSFEHRDKAAPHVVDFANRITL